MANLNEIVTIVINNCRRCIIGIEQRHYHTLRIAKLSLNHDINILREMRNYLQHKHQQAIVQLCIVCLQQLRCLLSQLLLANESLNSFTDIA